MYESDLEKCKDNQSVNRFLPKAAAVSNVLLYACSVAIHTINKGTKEFYRERQHLLLDWLRHKRGHGKSHGP